MCSMFPARSCHLSFVAGIRRCCSTGIRLGEMPLCTCLLEAELNLAAPPATRAGHIQCHAVHHAFDAVDYVAMGSELVNVLYNALNTQNECPGCGGNLSRNAIP